ncbi:MULTISPECIES: hypothetical protein [Kocuria]|jgi:hypothetical protein|uniref:hypothetical protein n=1 Tax=Kocuria TaxID=57493 RepID=UPI00203BBDC8|nr:MULTISPECIES: hypothetical protein [Kocuria]MCM3686581.1 hypothetical protein [Kocuria rosea]HST70835.1 hypothetical protein [Kocuria rosea]
MSEAPGTSFEFNEADRLEQSIDAERPEMDDQDVETPAHRDRSEASSLEANPADLEEQDQEVVLEDREVGSTLEEE